MKLRMRLQRRLYGICSVCFPATGKMFLSFRGVFRNLSRGGLTFFYLSSGGPLHQLGSENPLKSIDFTRPGRLSPHSPPEYAPDFIVKLINKPLNDFD